MNPTYSLSCYDYNLPPQLVAQHPLPDRDSSRLMVLDRITGEIRHRVFKNVLDYINPEDCLVLNNSKVFPARLLGRKSTGGRVELFLLDLPVQQGPGKASVEALYKSSKPLRQGMEISFNGGLSAQVQEVLSGGRAKIELKFQQDLIQALEASGRVPLPPYIKREPDAADLERYQTVFARELGSVAAPTAGLHFTPDLLDQIQAKGTQVAWVTLHVGYGTFSPVRTEDIRTHHIHSEWLSIPERTVRAVEHARGRGGKVIAVGTTSVRALESCASNGQGCLKPYEGACDLYIYPGYSFKVVDKIITNFHLPKSSLLLLVCAFAGREKILDAYAQAVAQAYRFYSYGDAMLIL